MPPVPTPFHQRVNALPHLGIGVSTEYGASEAEGSLDIVELREQHPEWASFLEVGVEAEKGIDAQAIAWREAGLPTTYHFLDINLDEPEDFDTEWLDRIVELTNRLEPAWLCGDAGLWHFGRRERGHMLLLPPILDAGSADAMADGIIRLREHTGYEVFPENPPGAVYLGDLHLLEFFARVCERADTGLLLDGAHLAIYQRIMGNEALDGLADFPCERIVEMHVAGGVEQQHRGFRFIEDSHSPQVLDPTWEIFDFVSRRANNLKAVVFECERNSLHECVGGFSRIETTLQNTPFASLAES